MLRHLLPQLRRQPHAIRVRVSLAHMDRVLYEDRLPVAQLELLLRGPPLADQPVGCVLLPVLLLPVTKPLEAVRGPRPRPARRRPMAPGRKPGAARRQPLLRVVVVHRVLLLRVAVVLRVVVEDAHHLRVGLDGQRRVVEQALCVVRVEERVVELAPPLLP